MDDLIKCNECRFSVPDWTNPDNPDHYCKNSKSYYYGYNTCLMQGCEEGEENV